MLKVASHLSFSSKGGGFSSSPFFDTHALLSINFLCSFVTPKPMTSPQLRLQLQLKMFSPLVTTNPLVVRETPCTPISYSPALTCQNDSSCTKPIQTSPWRWKIQISKQQDSDFCLSSKKTACGLLPLKVTLQQGPECSSSFFSMTRLQSASPLINSNSLVFFRFRAQKIPRSGRWGNCSGFSLNITRVRYRRQKQKMQKTMASITAVVAASIQKVCD